MQDIFKTTMRIAIKPYVTSQVAYSPLIQMLCSRWHINHKMGIKNCLKRPFSSYEELLSKDKSVTVDQETFEYLLLKCIKYAMVYP